MEALLALIGFAGVIAQADQLNQARELIKSKRTSAQS